MGDFPKSILHVEDFRRQSKSRYYIINTGDSRLILGKWILWPEMLWENFFTLIFHAVKKTFVIFRNAFVIFRNPFHCRYNGADYIFNSLHCPQHSVFLCVCNANFEEIFLYSMLLNP